MLQGKSRQATETSQPQQPWRPIDMYHLERQALGDTGLGLEILRMFDEIVTVHFARLGKAVEKSDRLHHLHTLKAASAGVGAWTLAEHAHVMEGEVKADAPMDPERLADIEIAIAEVHAFIADRIAEDERRMAQA